MVRPLIALALSPALLLAACNDGPGTNISIDANSEDGNAAISVDKDGQSAIKIPGIDASVKLPAIKIDADNFDLNGVRLYPGSTVTDLKVNAEDKPGQADEGRVRVRFDAPASADTVRDWFRKAMTDKGFTVEAKGTGLTGKTNDGEPFTLDLAPGGEGKSQGVLAVAG